MPTTVEARFYVSAVKLVPIQSGHYDADKKWVNDPTEIGAQVEMNAAKHGTFGKATPNGNINMLIQNPGAAEVFKEAFERLVKEKGRTPRFKVYFVEDENQEPDTY